MSSAHESRAETEPRAALAVGLRAARAQVRLCVQPYEA